MEGFKKIGFIILVLVWPVSYYFKHISPLVVGIITKDGYDLNTLIVDYIITVCYCIGTSIISYCEFKKAQKNWVKYLFWNSITMLGGVIVLTYIIDLCIDRLMGTQKLIYISIISTLLSLCIYFSKYNRLR